LRHNGNVVFKFPLAALPISLVQFPVGVIFAPVELPTAQESGGKEEGDGGDEDSGSGKRRSQKVAADNGGSQEGCQVSSGGF